MDSFNKDDNKSNEHIVNKNKLLEQENIELKQKINKLEDTIDILIEEQKMASLGKMIAEITHEINTPVGICITGSSSLLQKTQKIADFFLSEKMSKGELKDYLETVYSTAKLILSNMERSGNLINSLKQTAVDQISEKKQNFNFKQMLKYQIDSIYPIIKNKKLEIKIECDEKITINSYPGAFSQIIINLILNTIYHGLNGIDKGKIEITASLNESDFCIKYKDNGIGINESIITKIFEPFFTTNIKSGTGLGLYIVHKIVTKKLKGKIECSSQENNGVLFIITIPDILVIDET